VTSQKSKPFHVRVLEQIARPPTNEALIASDLRVTVPSVKRVVDTLVKQGDVERVEVPGYTPHLALTRQGREYLREREPGWWKTRGHRDPNSSRKVRSDVRKVHMPLTRASRAKRGERSRDVLELRGDRVFTPQSTEGRWVRQGSAWLYLLGRVLVQIKKTSRGYDYTVFVDQKSMQEGGTHTLAQAKAHGAEVASTWHRNLSLPKGNPKQLANRQQTLFRGDRSSKSKKLWSRREVGPTGAVAWHFTSPNGGKGFLMWNGPGSRIFLGMGRTFFVPVDHTSANGNYDTRAQAEAAVRRFLEWT